MEKKRTNGINNLKKFWNKFWFVVWKDNSPKGWGITLIFLFVLIKFLFFPLLSLTTGTVLPLAIVESCSMYHKNNIFSDTGSWGERHESKYSQWGIGREEFEKFDFNKGFTKGDILFITGVKPEKIEVGDVIIFEAGSTNPIIHRVIQIRETPQGRIFSTIGDNNPSQLSGFGIDETNIHEDQLIGKAQGRILPYIGWIKLLFYEFSKPSYAKGFCGEN